MFHYLSIILLILLMICLHLLSNQQAKFVIFIKMAKTCMKFKYQMYTHKLYLLRYFAIYYVYHKVETTKVPVINQYEDMSPSAVLSMQ